LALALAGQVGEITGVDPDPRAREEALERGMVSRAAAPAEAGPLIEAADLVVLATPLGQMAGALEGIASYLRPGAVLTDIGSAKASLMAELQPLVPKGVTYVPGHPIAGSDDAGIAGARGDMYRGAIWAVIGSSHPLVHAMIEAVGARVLMVSAEDHDATVSHTSHLPYLMAAATARVSCRRAQVDQSTFRLLAGGGFLDTTRVAGSSAAMGADMCLYNRDNLLPALEEAQAVLKELTSLLRREDRQGLQRYLEEIRRELAAVRGDAR